MTGIMLPDFCALPPLHLTKIFGPDCARGCLGAVIFLEPTRIGTDRRQHRGQFKREAAPGIKVAPLGFDCRAPSIATKPQAPQGVLPRPDDLGPLFGDGGERRPASNCSRQSAEGSPPDARP